MKSVIIGTAGHIDHGKTALVRALTGINADRLEEEKRRGITIDLGFAHLDLTAPDGTPLRLGFVDVPGHERFVRNMLAGVGGIDLVLFVIAADESIKPQTREHFDICQLLAVQRGITVLTKADLVDQETLGVVKMEVEDFLRGSFLDAARAPIICVSAKTGAGIAELKQAIAEQVVLAAARDSAALPRLPIDRVFTMKGFGTVVTGTLLAGAVRKEDELEVYPSGQRVRVRGVQVHGASAEQAVAGQRTALNLAGVDPGHLARGMTLGPVAALQATERVDVSLTLLSSAKPLKDRARVHLHSQTMETIAEVVLLREKQVSAGGQAFVRLRLADKALLLPGDRFIVRQFSPVVTIGGGVVLDAAPVAKEKKEILETFLETLSQGQPEAILQSRIARRSHRGLSIAQAVAETGWRREFIDSSLAGSIRAGSVVRVGSQFVLANGIAVLSASAMRVAGDFQKQNPLAGGMGKEQLRENLHASPEIFAYVLEQLVKERKLAASGEMVHPPGQGVVLKDEEAASKEIIESAFATAGLKVPALSEVLGGLKIDRVRAQKLVTLLMRDKILVKVSDELVFHRDALAGLRSKIATHKLKSPKIDVAVFKDLAGISRKYAIPLLEYFDRERVTRREGDTRVIL